MRAIQPVKTPKAIQLMKATQPRMHWKQFSLGGSEVSLVLQGSEDNLALWCGRALQGSRAL